MFPRRHIVYTSHIICRNLPGKVCKIKKSLKIKKLEENVAWLLENVASAKTQVSAEIKEIKYNVELVKTGLEAEIDRLSVSVFLYQIHVIY